MKNLRFIVWIATGLGALGGYLYWKEIGCLTGSCPLKSQWQTMVPIGAYFGFFFGDLLKGFLASRKRAGSRQNHNKE